jgi:transposase
MIWRGSNWLFYCHFLGRISAPHSISWVVMRHTTISRGAEMTTIVQLPRSVRRRLQHVVRKTREVGLRTRALIMLHAAAGKGTAQIADAVGYHPSAVLKVVHRFVVEGEAGLRDHRADNGYPKVNDDLRGTLVALVYGSPEDYGWARPTWTQELLARQLTHETRVRISASTVARTLAELGARWGMARPTVECPWAPAVKGARVRAIEQLAARLPAGEEAFYEDDRRTTSLAFRGRSVAAGQSRDSARC